jgi:hypothetical protein
MCNVGDCGARGPWTKDEASAIAMWNKRERDKLRAVRRSGEYDGTAAQWLLRP